jgi:hypothetical protein
MKSDEESYARFVVTEIEENRMGSIWYKRKIHRKFWVENGRR